MPAGRKDHTLLRDEQLHEGLLQGEGEQPEEKKDRATVFRLLGLARKELWVGTLLLKACTPCITLNAHNLALQLLLLASVALLVSSLATIAVPNSVGQLIDTCIKFSTDKAKHGEDEAKRELNREPLLEYLQA